MKLIGITQRVILNQSYPERRDALAQDWAGFLETVGITYIPLPNALPAVKKLLQDLPLTGFILSGGNDLVAYGGDAPERDEVEHFLLETSKTGKKPVIGVCRGLQMMVDHEGGELARIENHAATRHALSTGREVNSYHTCAIERLPEGFSEIARAADGRAEYVRHKTHNWTGIMWHPEREATPAPEDVTLFREVFTA